MLCAIYRPGNPYSMTEGMKGVWTSAWRAERDPHERQREVTKALVVSTVVFTWMALVQTMLANPPIGWMSAAAAAGCICVAGGLKISGRTLLAAHLLTVICFVFIGMVAVVTAGAAIGALFFMALIPVVALQAIGLRAAFGWAFVCVSLQVWLLWQRGAGLMPLIEIPPSMLSNSSNRAAIIFLIILLLVLAASEVARHAASVRAQNADHERQRLNQALFAESDRYRALVGNSRDLIVELDASGTVVYASANQTQVLGVTDLIGTKLVEWVGSSDRQSQSTLFRQLLRDDELLDSPPVRYQGDDGEWRWIEASGRRYQTANEDQRIVMRLRNVTSDLEFQRRLQQTQKLQAVGQLAGGVAHDFNNLLTVVMGCADEIVAAPDRAVQMANEILVSAERGSALTSQLLAFSRESVYKPLVTDLSMVVSGIGDMLERLLGKQTELHFDLPVGLPNVEIDPRLVEQLIVNLAVNARDASPGGGRIDIRTGLFANEDSVGEGDVFVEVADNGAGMSPEVAKHAFEPFFTTKEVGGGTGLGLALVHGVVEQMGGEVLLETMEGEGTTVKVRFPSTLRPATVPDQRQRQTGNSGVGRTILVVEDQRAIRKLISNSLASSGFEVLLAEDGESALSLVENGDHVIDLVVSDVVMPNISGPDMMRRLRATNPGIKVLFISGYSKTHSDDGPDPEDPLLQKPFRGHELVSRVQALLDGADNSSLA